MREGDGPKNKMFLQKPSFCTVSPWVLFYLVGFSLLKPSGGVCSGGSGLNVGLLEPDMLLLAREAVGEGMSLAEPAGLSRIARSAVSLTLLEDVNPDSVALAFIGGSECE